MGKKVLFIVNPVAGKGQIRHQLMDVLEIFAQAGWETTCLPTLASADAVRRAAERDPSYEMIVCCGGDGTLDEVVGGMMESALPPVPVGYLPAGSTNDFASSLQIPTDLLRAAQTAVGGRLQACDIGCLNGADYFVYVAAFGLFTEVTYETPQEMKNALGHIAYIIKGMQSLTNLQTYHVIVEADDVYLEDDFAVGMVTNSRSVGGFKNITGKYVDLSDGLFEATFIKMPRNPVELNQILAALANKDIDSPYIFNFKTAKLKVTSEKPINWTKDGEFGGSHTEIVLENRKQALEIVVPQET